MKIPSPWLPLRENLTGIAAPALTLFLVGALSTGGKKPENENASSNNPNGDRLVTWPHTWFAVMSREAVTSTQDSLSKWNRRTPSSLSKWPSCHEKHRSTAPAKIAVVLTS